MAYWKNVSTRSTLKTTPFYCFSTTTTFFFFSVCALLSTIIGITRSTPCSSDTLPCSLTSKAMNPLHQEMYKNNYTAELESGGMVAEKNSALSSVSGARSRAGRALLSTPGSSPPRCTTKCGRCTPCKPVHVPVPPGTPVTAEYYPEAWRCKCGSKLYVP